MAKKSPGNGRTKSSKPAKGAGASEDDRQPAANAALKGKARAISPGERRSLYAAAQYLPSDIEREFGLHIPFVVFLQDPQFAKDHPGIDVDEKIDVKWEPGLTDGPTSARFAVVDFNGDTGHLAPAAKWDEKRQDFVSGQAVLDKADATNLQFHLVNVWALLQRTLAFFEN